MLSNLVDAGETLLATQEINELDAQVLAIEILVKVDEVSLEQWLLCVLMKRRSHTDVDRRSYSPAVGQRGPGGVHTLGRPCSPHLVGDVRCREANRAAPLIAKHNFTTDFVGPTQHGVGRCNIAACECSTDSRRRDWLDCIAFGE